MTLQDFAYRPFPSAAVGGVALTLGLPLAPRMRKTKSTR